MNAIKILISALLLSAIRTTDAVAGPYADELSKCLVESTTQNDRIELVRWFFSAASLHPAVEPLSTLTAEQVDAANKTIAEMITKLLTASCRSETEAALQYEGPSTIELSFQVLGQVAGKELFTSPEVAAGLSGLERHLDLEALSSLKGLQ